MFSRTSICIAALLAVWFVAISLWWLNIAAHSPQVYMENHWLEWAQLGLVSIASLCHLVRWVRNTGVRQRFMFLTMSTLVLSILLREFESDDLPVQDIWTLVDSMSGWLTLALWIGLGWCWGANLRRIEQDPRRELGGPFLATIAAIAIYALGWPFDHLHWSLGGLKPMLIEELIEFHGSTVMLMASLMPWAVRSKHPTVEAVSLWNDAPEALQQVSA